MKEEDCGSRIKGRKGSRALPLRTCIDCRSLPISPPEFESEWNPTFRRKRCRLSFRNGMARRGHGMVTKSNRVRLNGEEEGDGISMLRELLMVLKTGCNQRRFDVSAMASKQRPAYVLPRPPDTCVFKCTFYAKNVSATKCRTTCFTKI